MRDRRAHAAGPQTRGGRCSPSPPLRPGRPCELHTSNVVVSLCPSKEAVSFMLPWWILLSDTWTFISTYQCPSVSSTGEKRHMSLPPCTLTLVAAYCGAVEWSWMPFQSDGAWRYTRSP